MSKLFYLAVLFVLCSSSLISCAATGAAQPSASIDPVASNVRSQPSASETPKTQMPLDMYPKKTGNPYVIGGIKYYPLDSVSDDYTETGVASWYGKDFHGGKTANGEIYNMNDLTAAHKTLPMPTFVRVKNLDNGKETVVRINDRGPFSKGRIIDLSYAAAKELDIVDAGTAKVQLTVLSQTQDHLRTEGKDVDINQGAYAVQIGSFMDQNNANRLAARFNNAAVRKVTVNDKLFYRVQVRGYKNKQDALTAASNFDKEFTGAFVIAE